MKPTSIIYLVLSLILIATGYVSMEMAQTLAQTEGTSLFSDVTDEDGNRISTVYFNSAEYDKIEVNISNATVYLCVGDEEKVVFKNYTEGSYTGMESGVAYVISDNMSAIDMITSGNFNLSFKGLRHYWHDRDILSREKEVYVYTTSNTDLNSIDLRLLEGTINISDYKASFDVMGYVEKGEINLTGSQANSFNFTGESCILNAQTSSAPRFHTDITGGKITMQSCEIAALTQLNIKETGEVSVELSGAGAEYNITAYASKSVTYNGKNVGTQYPPEGDALVGDGTDNTGTKTLDINVVSGTVNIKTK